MSQLTAATLSPERLDDFLAFIKPTSEELRWTEINWETDLWEARKKAAAVGKPLFLWAMNGDPLGCV
ncbi:MAG TPA: hypothetical protein VFK80_03155 [Limnochordia bacterium]|nr:hypothetical protein [Limnochordia bacterium]